MIRVAEEVRKSVDFQFLLLDSQAQAGGVRAGSEAFQFLLLDSDERVRRLLELYGSVELSILIIGFCI